MVVEDGNTLEELVEARQYVSNSIDSVEDEIRQKNEALEMLEGEYDKLTAAIREKKVSTSG